jgi:DNA-binding transcriptional LysR family regulator
MPRATPWTRYAADCAAPLDLVVPSGHRLAARVTVALGDLAGESFVDFPIGYGNRTIVDRAFASAQVPRRIVLEITDIAMAADCVRHGLGIAILPRFVIGDDFRLRYLPITDPGLPWPMFVISPATRPLGAAAGALLDLLLPPRNPGITSKKCCPRPCTRVPLRCQGPQPQASVERVDNAG